MHKELDVVFTSSDGKLTQVSVVGDKDWEKVYSLLSTSCLPNLL